MSATETTSPGPTASSQPYLLALLLGLAFVPATAAFHSAGLIRQTDIGMVALGVAAVLGFVIMIGTLRRRPLVDRSAWRVTAAVLAAFLGAALVTALSSQWFTSLLGAPAVSTGLAQLACAALIAAGAAFKTGTARRFLGYVAPFVIGIQLLVAGYENMNFMHPGGTLTNSSYMGQIVLLLLPFALAPLLSAVGRKRIAGYVVGAAVAAMLVWLESFYAAGLAVTFLVAFALVSWRRPRLKSDRVTIALVVGALLLAAMPPVLTSLSGGDLASAAALGPRPPLWEAGFEAAAVSPIVGHGLNGYRVAASPFIGDEVMQEGVAGYRSMAAVAGDPHNLPLGVFDDGGVLGLVLFAWLLFEVARNWRLQSDAGPAAPNWAAWGGALFLASGVLAPLSLQTMGVAAFVVGASLRPEFPKKTSSLLGRMGAAPAQKVFGVVALLFAVLTIAYGGTRLWIGAAPDGAPQAQRAQSATGLWTSDGFLFFWEGRQWWLQNAGGDALRASEGAASRRSGECLLLDGSGALPEPLRSRESRRSARVRPCRGAVPGLSRGAPVSRRVPAWSGGCRGRGTRCRTGA